MKNARATHVALAAVLAAQLITGCCSKDEPPPAVEGFEVQPIDVPLVFVSRDSGPGELAIEAQGRELRPGGALYRVDPDGVVRALVHTPELFDVSRPSVSFDAQWVAFAGLDSELGSWSIYKVPAGGGPAERLTRPAANPVQDFIDATEDVDNRLKMVGDHSPAWLPDGRVAFASTRYPTLAASCGERSTNLYVMNGDGGDLHRISTSRSGLIDPDVLADGRIVASYYRDNMNAPHPEEPGLRAIEPDRHWQDRYWFLWAMNPDGTGAARFANVVGGVDGDHMWGVHQPRELPSGDMVATVREDATLIDRLAFTSAVVTFSPGYQAPRHVRGLGAIFDSGEGHAMAPAPLADGRIVLSFGEQAFVDGGREVRPDFDLVVVSGDLDPASMIPVVSRAGSDELDAVAVVERAAPVIDDTVHHAPSEDPRVQEGTTATLINSNVYADLPLTAMERLSPRPYSVDRVVFYDDSQQFHTEDNEQLSKQMPVPLMEVPVAADGSFRAEVPADRPIFFQLVGHTDVASRLSYLPTDVDGVWTSHTFFVTVHDFLRPGTEASCQGCHAGHMVDADAAMDEAQVNVARMATTWHQDSYPGTEAQLLNGPFRAVDQRLARVDNTLGWVSQSEPVLHLYWATDVVVDEVVLHPLPTGSHLDTIRVTGSGGAVVSTGPLDSGDDPLVIDLGGQSTMTLSIELDGSGAVGLSEVEVRGELPASWPEVPLAAPTGLALDGMLNLSWTPVAHPALGGYELLVSDPGGEVMETLDIGNVPRHAKLLDRLDPGQQICLALRPYDLLGRSSGNTSAAVCGAVPGLRVDSIEPSVGVLGAISQVVIRGEGFGAGNDFLPAIGGFKLLDFTVVDDTTIEATTRPDRPREAGTFAVSVSYDNGLRASLEDAFTLALE
jgi:hypothetical protein